MFVIRVLILLFSIILLGYGYLIKFKHKYALIIGYEEKDPRVSDKYCEMMGLIFCAIGSVALVLGVISFFLEEVFSIWFFVVIICATIGTLYFSQVDIKKK